MAIIEEMLWKNPTGILIHPTMKVTKQTHKQSIKQTKQTFLELIQTQYEIRLPYFFRAACEPLTWRKLKRRGRTLKLCWRGSKEITRIYKTPENFGLTQSYKSQVL